METPQQIQKRLQETTKIRKEAMDLYKKYLARGNTPEEAKALTIEVYPAMAPKKDSPSEVAQKIEMEQLQEESMTKRNEMTQAEM